MLGELACVDQFIMPGQPDVIVELLVPLQSLLQQIAVFLESV